MTAPEAQPFLKRLATVRERLRAQRSAVHHGVTAPDDGASERWTADNVWAHLAEFPVYWVKQAEGVASAYEGSPVPFGRTKRDTARRAAVDAGTQGIDPWPAIDHGITATRDLLTTLPAEGWSAVGAHPTLGDMPMERIVEEFIVGHLEEHAAQLDGLEDDGPH